MGGLRVRAQGQGDLQGSGGTWATDPGGTVSFKQVVVSLEATDGTAALESDFIEESTCPYNGHSAQARVDVAGAGG